MPIDNKVIITLDNGKRIEAQAPVIISASRSTDIPAFYSDWFFDRLNKGYSVWTNPFNGLKSYISYENKKNISNLLYSVQRILNLLLNICLSWKKKGSSVISSLLWMIMNSLKREFLLLKKGLKHLKNFLLCLAKKLLFGDMTHYW